MARSKVVLYGAGPVEVGRPISRELKSESWALIQKLVISVGMQFIKQKLPPFNE